MDFTGILSLVIGIVGVVVTVVFYIFDRRRRRVIGWKTVLQSVDNIAQQLKNENWEPEVLLAFPKGGLIVADLLDHHYDCELDIVAIHTKRVIEDRLVKVIIRAPYTNFEPLRNKRVLVVDDVLESGDTMKNVVSLIQAANVPAENIRTAVLGIPENFPTVLIADYHVFTYDRTKKVFLPWGEVTL